jgi:hypothetical protein
METNEYNEEPVYYCSECGSLKIITEEGVDRCGVCGSKDISVCHIDEWSKSVCHIDEWSKKFNNKNK